MSTPPGLFEATGRQHLEGGLQPRNLLDPLDRYAYHGFAAAISMGADMGELLYQLREEVITRSVSHCFARSVAGSPGRFGAIRPGLQQDPVGGYHPRAGRPRLAPQRPRFVKIWVDGHNHTQKRLTPELYGAAIDEAHKHKRRAIAHVFDLEDAKGLLRASVDGFTHLVTRQGP